MIKHLNILIREDEAASAVEYAVLLAFIAAVIVLAVQGFGGAVSNAFTSVDPAFGGGGAPPTCCD